MKDRIDDHIEFHEANDKHKSDVAFLKEVKAYIEEIEADARRYQAFFSDGTYDYYSELLCEPKEYVDKKIDEWQSEGEV